MLGKRGNAPVSETRPHPAAAVGWARHSHKPTSSSPGGSVFSLGTAWFRADVAVLSWAPVGSVLKAEVLPLTGAERDLYA